MKPTALFLSLLLVSASSSEAATFTWDGGGGDSNWLTALNWSADVAPTALISNDLAFGGTLNLTTNNNFTAGSSFGNLTFAAGAGAFSLGGNDLTLAGNITNSSSNAQVINLNTTLPSGYHSFTSTSSAVTLAGTVSRTTGTSVNFSTTGTFNGAGLLSAIGTTGAGWATIGGTDFAVSNGTQIVAATYTSVTGSQTGAGASAQNWKTTANTTLTSSATINSLNQQNDFTLNSGVTLTLASGGLILGSTERWFIGSGGTIKSGLGTGELYIHANTTGYTNGFQIQPLIANGSAATTVYKDGAGQVTMVNSGNSFSGGFQLNGGAVYLGSSSTGTGGSVTSGPLGTGTVTLNSGTLNLWGKNSGTSVNSLTLGNNISATGSSATIDTISGGTSTLSGVISGAGGISKTGSGTLVLTGANTHTGTMTLSAGTLEFQGASSMSTGTTLGMATGTTLSLKADADASFAPATFSNLTAGSTYSINANSITGGVTGKTLSIKAPVGGGGGTGTTTLNVNGTASAGYTLKFSTAFNTNSNNGGAWTTASQNVFNLTNADVILDAGLAMGNNGDGGITLASTTGNSLTINGVVTTNNNRTTAAVVSSGTLNLNNTVALSGTNQGFFVVLNGGTLNLNNAGSIRNNASIGGTGNRAGFLIAGGTLGNTSGAAVTLTTNPTIQFNSDFAFATAGSTSANDLNLGTGTIHLGSTVGTSRTITTNGVATLTLGGVISDGTTANSLTKSGAGVLQLNGANTFTGGVGLTQGTLVYGNASALGSGTLVFNGGTLKAGGAYTIANAATVSAASQWDMAGNNTTYSGALGGSGGLTLSNSGFASTLTLSGNNSSFTGTFTAGNGNALNFTSANSGSAGAAWVFNDANVDRVRINLAGGGTLHFGALSGSGQIQNDTASTSSTLSVGALGTSTTFSGTINDNGTGTLGLTKTGSGTLTLAGANAYSGLTSVNAGTLALGATGSINGTSGVSLGSGGTFDVSAKTGGYSVNRLSGSGTVVGSLSITTELAIGNSPGTSYFQNLTLGALSKFTYELDGGSSSADLGIVSGDLTISTGAVLDLVQLGTYTTNDKFTLFGYQTGHLSGTFSGLSDGAVFTDAGGSWKINYFDTTSGLNGGTGTRFVTVTAVPEPRAALIGGVGLLLLLRRRK